MKPAKKLPEQIEAEPWKDYVPKPDKGSREPFMAPGGLLALIGLVASFAIYYFAGQYLGPIVRSAVHSLTGL
jgi:hypothetical protein